MFTMEEAGNSSATNFNFLDYYRSRLGIEKYRDINGAGFQTRLPGKPVRPATLSLISKSKKVVKTSTLCLQETII